MCASFRAPTFQRRNDAISLLVQFLAKCGTESSGLKSANRRLANGRSGTHGIPQSRSKLTAKDDKLGRLNNIIFSHRQYFTLAGENLSTSYKKTPLHMRLGLAPADGHHSDCLNPWHTNPKTPWRACVQGERAHREGPVDILYRLLSSEQNQLHPTIPRRRGDPRIVNGRYPTCR